MPDEEHSEETIGSSTIAVVCMEGDQLISGLFKDGLPGKGFSDIVVMTGQNATTELSLKSVRAVIVSVTIRGVLYGGFGLANKIREIVGSEVPIIVVGHRMSEHGEALMAAGKLQWVQLTGDDEKSVDDVVEILLHGSTKVKEP